MRRPFPAVNVWIRSPKGKIPYRTYPSGKAKVNKLVYSPSTNKTLFVFQPLEHPNVSFVRLFNHVIGLEVCFYLIVFQASIPSTKKNDIVIPARKTLSSHGFE